MNLSKAGARHCNEPPLWSGMYAATKCAYQLTQPIDFRREEKVKHKIERIFRIWEQRAIYNEEFLSDLRGLLSINPAKKPPPNENDDEQATITVANIKNCIKLEKETDRSFKSLPKASLCDKDTISQLKGMNFNTNFKHWNRQTFFQQFPLRFE